MRVVEFTKVCFWRTVTKHQLELFDLCTILLALHYNVHFSILSIWFNFHSVRFEWAGGSVGVEDSVPIRAGHEPIFIKPV